MPEEIGQLPGKAVPHVLFEDHSGALWIGTTGDGLFRFHAGVMENIPTSHPAVDSISEDREGNIWAGTNGGGLNQVRPRAVVLFGRDSGLPSESVRSVSEDSAGGLWAVMQNGMLVRNLNGGWVAQGPATGWPGGDVSCVAADRVGGVWIGTRDRGLFHLEDGSWHSQGGLTGDSVRSILVAVNGDVWVATDSVRRLLRLRAGNLLTIEAPEGIRSIRAMAEGPDGTIWIGTAEGLILRVSGEQLIRESAITENPPISVRSLHATPDGTLWIGYAGYGVGRLKTGKYARISTATGLMDDYASQIFADSAGSMWIAGNHGLFQVSLAELAAVAEGGAERVRSRIFGRGEGLANIQPNYDNFPSVCRAADGSLWFAVRTGLLNVRPERIRESPEPPKIVLERLFVDDEPVAQYNSGLSLQGSYGGSLLVLNSPAASIRLGPGHRKIKFDFAALSFTSPENVQFRYRMNRFDEKWVEAGTQHSATYPQLPAGDYQFQVIACNSAGVWNEVGASIKLSVAPFYWQTWWFRGLALLAFTAGVIGIVRYVTLRRVRERMRELKQQAALQKERARIARDMHDEVGSKLTRLSLLGEMAGCHPGLSPEANADVQEISDTARETILAFDEIVWAVNPRNDTLADLVNYLCRHAEEFFEGSTTDCVFDLPQVIPPVMLPTEVRHQVFLAAKEALNNVLKHAKASQVCIRMILHPGTFELVIHDDGCGFEPGAPSRRAGGGSGMFNIQDRISGIGGRFECTIQPGQGTHISFVVPIA